MNEAAVSSTANSALITFAIYLLGVFSLPGCRAGSGEEGNLWVNISSAAAT